VVLKVIAKGLVINGPDSYLRQHWNVLDCVIVVVSLISIGGLHDSTYSIFKEFKLIRVLRPLRVIGRN
jgi:hypothetical protein